MREEPRGQGKHGVKTAAMWVNTCLAHTLPCDPSPAVSVTTSDTRTPRQPARLPHLMHPGAHSCTRSMPQRAKLHTGTHPVYGTSTVLPRYLHHRQVCVRGQQRAVPQQADHLSHRLLHLRRGRWGRPTLGAPQKGPGEAWGVPLPRTWRAAWAGRGSVHGHADAHVPRRRPGAIQCYGVLAITLSFQRQ